jgi:hypothetical protein
VLDTSSTLLLASPQVVVASSQLLEGEATACSSVCWQAALTGKAPSMADEKDVDGIDIKPLLNGQAVCCPWPSSWANGHTMAGTMFGCTCVVTACEWF